MRKVMGNKVYDTDTARMVGSFEEDGAAIGLYRKRTGEYFVGISDAPAGAYSVRLRGSGRYVAGPVAPVTYDEARATALDRLDADAYAAEFGGDGDASMQPVHVRIPAEYKAALDRIKARSGHSMSEIVSEMAYQAMCAGRWRDLIEDGEEEAGLREHMACAAAMAGRALGEVRDALWRLGHEGNADAIAEVDAMGRRLAEMALPYDDSWFGALARGEWPAPGAGARRPEDG